MHAGIMWVARFLLLMLSFAPIAIGGVVALDRWGRAFACPRWLSRLAAAGLHRRSRARLEAGARALGLIPARPSATSTIAVGLLGRRPTLIRSAAPPGGSEHLRIEIEIATGTGIGIGRAARFEPSSIRVALEPAAVVTGDEERARGWLESPLQDLARPGDSVSLERGRLAFDRFGPTEPKETIALARRLAAMAAALEERLDEPIEATIARTAEVDPRPEIRLRALGILLRKHAATPAATKALESALGSPDPAVRLVAARSGGARAEAVLVALVVGSADNEVATQALHQWMCRPRPEREQIELLAALLLDSRSTPLEIAAIDWLRRSERAIAEPLFLRALAPCFERPVRLAAVDALARGGTDLAVPPLFELQQHPRTDPELARMARSAIAEICGRRAVGASPGALALAEPRRTEAGALSRTLGPGELSIVRPPL
jgi:hypothetical protein